MFRKWCMEGCRLAEDGHCLGQRQAVQVQVSYFSGLRHALVSN